MKFLLTYFTINFFIQITFSEGNVCKNRIYCYGTEICNKIRQTKVTPNYESLMTCFKENASFIMGSNDPMFKSDGEAPARLIHLEPFCMDQTEVSNLQFHQFVLETNYKTDSEKLGDSFCLVQLLSDRNRENLEKAAAAVPWWVLVKNTTWFNPEGFDSNIYSRWNHPVIHVSWNDANAYCKYFNKRLPSEAEWEYACRGGLKDRLYPWGNSELPKGKHMMNIWQGRFPHENKVLDGFQATSPVDQFVQNKFNMKNIVGNVWEWTNDWWEVNHDVNDNKNPKGPNFGSEKVKKGGSFMCTPAFCHRYRCCARSRNTPDTSAMNLGFRCAKDV